MTATRVCYRHSDRPAGVSCQRCDRPICPSCMNQASVGFHCPECVAGSGKQKVIPSRAVFGSGVRRPPILTTVLITVNVAVFVIGLAVDADSAGTRISSFTEDFSLYGPCVNSNEFYRIITGGFLHAGLIHLLFNMFALFNIGPIIEAALGRVRFGLIYAVSLLGGSAGALILDPARPVVGASGAIFGMLGALFVMQRAVGINPWTSGVGMTIGLNLLITFAIPFISKGGHIGGLIAGAAAVWLMIELPRRTRNPNVAYLPAVLLPVLFVVAVLAARTAPAGSPPCEVIRLVR